MAPDRIDAPIHGGRYRKLFAELAPLDVDERELHVLGGRGGPCDVGADYVDGDDATVAAVWPFFGQFIAKVTTPPTC